MIRAFVFALLVSSTAFAQIDPGPSIEGNQSQLAAQHYQPFTGLKFYCFAGLLATYEGTQEWRDKDGQRETVFPGTNIAFGIGAIGWAAAALMGPHFSTKQATEPFSESQIDLATYESARGTFEVAYLITALSEVGMTVSSGNSQRWLSLVGGLATPFVLDQIFRPLFYGSRLSPWTNPAKFQVAPTVLRDGAPGLQFAASF